MRNRFLEMEAHLKRAAGAPRASGAGTGAGAGAATLDAPRRVRGALSGSLSSFAGTFAAQDRALVVLIENGGVDLGLPTLVQKILDVLPGASLLPDSVKTKLVDAIRDKITSLTDNLIEGAELALNRYTAAAPGQFGEVAVLRDGTASYAALKGKLVALAKAGKLVDLFVLTHGSEDFISVPGGIDGAAIRRMRDELGAPLTLRSVYMMNCKASTLNQAWLDAGAKVVSGAVRNNYLPEPTMFFFWQAWKDGQTFENAVTSAYRKTIKVMNEFCRTFVRALPVPGAGALADAIDFETFDFVTDSAPVIQGLRTVTVNTDNLAFTQSVAAGLATTVVPAAAIDALARGLVRGPSGALSLQASVPPQPGGHSYAYRSPSVVMQMTEYSLAQNPGALVIAGVEVADAISIGLATAGLVQAQVAASQGSFSLVYDKAARLLTNEARAQMPGSQTTKTRYKRRLFWISINRPNTAEADVLIDWEGNPYGEIGTPIIERNLSTSTEWSRSSANITITRTERIPLPKTDPRTWPIVYTYVGTYDPLGNGYFEFSGEFEINAFGGIKFNRHEVVSRSFADFMLGGTPEGKVRKGDDVVVPVPPVPQEQIDYLKAKLPN